MRNTGQKSAVFVPINRRTVDPNEYRPVDTKLNGDERKPRRGYGEEEDDGYENAKKDRNWQQGAVPYDGDRDRDRERERER
jgi:hypothetical protein